MSETAACRHITAAFCQGNGCDVGSGGDPVVPWAIQVDLPDEEFIRYGHAHASEKPIQYRGDARNLPFKDATMDFVYCVKEGSIVETSSGFKKIEHVCVGESVLTGDGFKAVVGTSKKNHSGEIISIKCHSNFRTLDVTPEHVVPVWRGGDVVFDKAENIKPGDYLISPFDDAVEDVEFIKTIDFLPENNPKYESVIKMATEGFDMGEISKALKIPRSTVWQYKTARRTPSDCFVDSGEWVSSCSKTKPVKSVIPVNDKLMRLVGYYISDGCASGSRPHSVCFYFGKHEKKYRDDVINLFEELFGISPSIEAECERGNIFHIRYCSKIAWHIFRSLGGNPKNKRIADWIMKLPPSKQLNLVGGMIAGDGTVSKDCTSVSYSSSSQSLSAQYQRVLSRIGIKSSISKTNQSSTLNGRVIKSVRYTVLVTGSDCDVIASVSGKKTGSPKMRMSRLSPNTVVISRGLAQKVSDVQTLKCKCDVYDLKIDSDTEIGKTFTANGFLVHNCSHLIEDFDDWPSVLNEFSRVLKHGGHLVIMVPDHKLFREAVANGQGDNLSHKHEFHVGELSDWARGRGGFEIIFDQLTLVRGIKDYNILFVAKKL